MNASTFQDQTGAKWYHTADQSPEDTEIYLSRIDFLRPAERVLSVRSAGAGNMNVTLRVITNQREFVLKQSRPWVAAFPQLAAPVERIFTEARYLEVTAANKQLAARSPRVLGRDDANYVLLTEFIELAEDAGVWYDSRRAVDEDQLRQLLHYLSALHGLRAPEFPANRKLRELNHAHVFDLPFRPDNGFPLDDIEPGLAAVAAPFQNDEALRAEASRLGEKYLADGGRCLLHGDFYPGSFLLHGENVTVIDGEFAFVGPPEYDLGVLMAHLILARSPAGIMRAIDREYQKPAGFSAGLARAFCYVEIIRRLIGIAQLPVDLTLAERGALLEQARAGLAL